MNLEIATRLVELRKARGYSQEELADKLGVTRQAVSKWERVEASPDTDNLIALARLYGISLDELLNIKAEREEKGEEKGEKPQEEEEGAELDSEGISIDHNGIHLRDDEGQEVHIGSKGVYVNDGQNTIKVGFGEEGHFHYNCGNGRHHSHNHGSRVNWTAESTPKPISALFDGISGLLCLVAYLLLGFLCDLWHPAWIIFLAIPVLPALICPKRWEGVFPILVVGAYLLMGLQYKLWHPGWVIFLAIPIFYTFWNFFKERIAARKAKKVAEPTTDKK